MGRGRGWWKGEGRVGIGADSEEDVLTKKKESSAAGMPSGKVREPLFFLWYVSRLWDLLCS